MIVGYVALLLQLCGAMLPKEDSLWVELTEAPASAKEPLLAQLGSQSRQPEVEEPTRITVPLLNEAPEASISEIKKLVQDDVWSHGAGICPFQSKLFLHSRRHEECKMFDLCLDTYHSIMNKMNEACSKQTCNPSVICEGVGLTLKYEKNPVAHFICEFKWTGGNQIIRQVKMANGKKRRHLFYRIEETVRISQCSDLFLIARPLSASHSQFFVYLIPMPSTSADTNFLPYQIWSSLEKELGEHSCDLAQFLKTHTVEQTVILEVPMIDHFYTTFDATGAPWRHSVLNCSYEYSKESLGAQVFPTTEEHAIVLDIPHICFLFDLDAHAILFAYHFDGEGGSFSKEATTLSVLRSNFALSRDWVGSLWRESFARDRRGCLAHIRRSSPD